MRAIGGGMTLCALVCVVAACFAAGSAHAAKGIQYGIQDDAWLESGPGTLDQRLTTFKRLGVPLVRFTLRWSDIARRRPKNPTSPRDRAYNWNRPGPGAARPAPLRPPARAHARRDAVVGERRALGGVGAEEDHRLPRLRDRRRQALPVDSLLADLERAQQAAMAQADEVADLRPVPAESGVRGDPQGAPAGSGRRRRDRASRRAGRHRTGRLAARHVPRAREVRRLRAPPVPLDAVARRRRAAAAAPARRSRWRRSGDSSSSSSSTSVRSRSGSPSTATSRTRRTSFSGSRPSGRRTWSVSPRCARGGCRA